MQYLIFVLKLRLWHPSWIPGKCAVLSILRAPSILLHLRYRRSLRWSGATRVHLCSWHARLPKGTFDDLRNPRDSIREGSCYLSYMHARTGYAQIERTIFNPVGQYKPVIESIDQNVQTRLATFATTFDSERVPPFP